MRRFACSNKGAETMFQETLPYPPLAGICATCYTHPAFHGTNSTTRRGNQ